MDHTAWIVDISHGASQREVARRCGISDRTIANQVERNGRVTADMVLLLAKAYGINPVTALVDTGYIAAEDSQLRGVSNAALSAEVHRRMEAGG